MYATPGAVFAPIAAIAGPWGGLDIATMILSAAFVVLLLLQFRELKQRRVMARDIEAEMEALRGANLSMRSAVDETKKKMAEVTQQVAAKSAAQDRKMVGELQMIERLIRDFAKTARRAEIPDAPRAPGEPAITRTTEPALDIIRRALEENRVDLYLQPVVSLPQRKVKYYEALSRLRSEDGAVIMPSHYIRIAAPAGLMSVVDNLLLFRCMQIVRRLTQKNRDVAVFCNISGHTLSDKEFFPQFLEYMRQNRDLAGQIVFEFAQNSVSEARAAEESNLRALSTLGFRLSLDQVTKLDMDFAKIKRLGFHFLKVRANTLISGMDEARAHVAAEDFKTLLARNGLNLIAERVEDEKTVIQLLDYDVDYGQGYLFGEPRPVREVPDVQDARTAQPNAAPKLAPGLARRLIG